MRYFTISSPSLTEGEMMERKSFPPIRNSVGLMSDYYRNIFDRYVANKPITWHERQAMVWFIQSTPNGRLMALNAIPPLRSHHLDALLREAK
jgi:hypothetical protein